MALTNEHWHSLGNIPLAGLSPELPQTFVYALGARATGHYDLLTPEADYLIRRNAEPSLRRLAMLASVLKESGPLAVAEVAGNDDDDPRVNLGVTYAQTVAGHELVPCLDENDVMAVFGRDARNPWNYALAIEPPAEERHLPWSELVGSRPVAKRYAGIETELGTGTSNAEFELAGEQAAQRPEIEPIRFSILQPYTSPPVLFEDGSGQVVTTETVLPASPRIIVVGKVAGKQVIDLLKQTA